MDRPVHRPRTDALPQRGASRDARGRRRHARVLAWRTLLHVTWIGVVLVQGLLSDSTEPAPGQLLDPLDERATSPSTTLVPRLPLNPAPPPHEALPPRPPLPPMEPIRPEPEPLDEQPWTE